MTPTEVSQIEAALRWVFSRQAYYQESPIVGLRTYRVWLKATFALLYTYMRTGDPSDLVVFLDDANSY